jgi:hypothetical protein
VSTHTIRIKRNSGYLAGRMVGRDFFFDFCDPSIEPPQYIHRLILVLSIFNCLPVTRARSEGSLWRVASEISAFLKGSGTVASANLNEGSASTLLKVEYLLS